MSSGAPLHHVSPLVPHAPIACRVDIRSCMWGEFDREAEDCVVCDFETLLFF